MSGFRVLGTGSRELTDVGVVRVALGSAISQAMGTVDWEEHANLVTVVHGNAPRGADQLIDQVAREFGCHVDKVDAPWGGPCCRPEKLDPLTDKPWCPPGHRKPRQRGDGTYCPRAGHRRNQEMVRRGANTAVAFPLGPSHGTRDCMKRIEAAGIELIGGAS